MTVWSQVVETNRKQDFFESSNAHDWLSGNLGNSRISMNFGIFWSFVYRHIVHELWFNHNARSHRTTFFFGGSTCSRQEEPVQSF